ncbi:hypothetical protein [Levilactobacillus spicheri]|uniref:hypothetical protein n=1 Tax=Levilactobacillus spicheri TaxID=216463 RepID=UPI000A9913B1|nr:hypothetical protein [Levilactobacillus spicheri]
MNLKRIILGLGTAIVLLAVVSGVSWVVTSHQSLTQNAQPAPHDLPTERVLSPRAK